MKNQSNIMNKCLDLETSAGDYVVFLWNHVGCKYFFMESFNH